METAALSNYLTKGFGEKIEVTGLRQAFPGVSRVTWLVDVLRGGKPAGLVVRADPAEGSVVPVPLKFEFEVYQRLQNTGIPVAPVYWFDEAPEVTNGSPLFVREMVDGVTYPPGLTDDTDEAVAKRKRVVFEYIEKIALVHKLDWKAFGFDKIMPAPLTPEAAATSELKRWTRVWDEVKTEPFPVYTEALNWLAENAPKQAAAVTLCKGQTGIGEEIWRDETLVAFSDWELAHIGDPFNDLAQSQGMLNMAPRDEIFAHYEQCVGFAVPRENVAFFTVLGVFIAALTLNCGLRPFVDGRTNRLARATLGYGKVKVYEHMMGKIIGMGLEEAEAYVHSTRPNPYHNKKVAVN